jgi:hypothetical protein
VTIGTIVELASAHDIVRAADALRARGMRRLEAYTPVPVHELDRALGRRRSRLALATGCGALCGVLGGYGAQWLVDAFLYPLVAGGRPPHMPLAFALITIEMGFLFGGLATLVALIALGGLGRLWHPAFEVPGFASATRDGFWLAIDGDDPHHDREVIAAELGAFARRIEVLR